MHILQSVNTRAGVGTITRVKRDGREHHRLPNPIILYSCYCIRQTHIVLDVLYAH